MKTKALLGALVVAVLAVFGVIGLRNAPDASAGDFAGATSFNPGTVLVGGSASSTITFYDDRPGTSSMMASAPGLTFTASSAVLASSAATSCAVSATGLGTSALTLVDTGCDANTTSQAWLWTVTVTCTAAGNYTANFAPAGFTGSIYNGTASSSVQPLACVTSSASGTNTITIRKVDQFGQPLTASFSIQQGPFWVEIARVNLSTSPSQNPCATDGTGGASCGLTGVISPNTFPSGLPSGTYRVVEIGGGGGLTTGGGSFCTLVGVYNGFSYTTGAQGAVNSTFWGSPLVAPYEITLPDANPLDLQLTFVNSCLVPGGPFAGTSGIAVVIGGSTPGLTNTANLETNPAPGSDSNARLDIRIRDSASIPIPNAHVTVLIDKGTLAMRRDLSSFPNGGYEVIEPVPGAVYFGSNVSGDTCDQATNGWWTQSASTGGYTWPYLSSSRTQQDGYTNIDGVLSACVYVDNILAPNTTPGKINVQAIVESPNQGGLYNGSTYYNPLYPNNLSLPNYLAAPNIVLTATITVVGPPASITVAAAPTSLNCGEKATVTVTVKDSAGQNVSDHTRVELVTNFGGVLGGTTATLGPVNVAGGQVFPQSSTSAETFNGVATAYLLTSTDHVGPYEVVAAAGGSVMASNGALAPWYNTIVPQTALSSTNALSVISPAYSGTPTIAAYYPWYQQGLLQYSPSSAPVNAQATVTCAVPGAPAAAAPAIAAPRTGQGPADAFAIRPPNTGDAGLAAGSSSNAMVYVAAGVAVFALAGLASLKFATRR